MISGKGVIEGIVVRGGRGETLAMGGRGTVSEGNFVVGALSLDNGAVI